MDHSPRSLPSTESSTKSSKSAYSGHPPGTPKPPIDPPRRRSSLFFSRVLQHTQSPKTPSGSTPESSASKTPDLPVTLPNMGRKRLPSPLTRSIAMPGHVAQMQKLFQNAKASLRLDVRFAASPIGSIDSRLPTRCEEVLKDERDYHGEESERQIIQHSKDWRYSTAPHLVAELDMDVREPFPEGGSPQLPTMLAVDLRHGVNLEPPSSGFTSPLQQPDPTPTENAPADVPSTPPRGGSDEAFKECDKPISGERVSTTDLEHPLRQLKVSTDYDLDMEEPSDDSPVVNHLKRKSLDVRRNDFGGSSQDSERIILSASAKAAADSAKVRRGITREASAKSPTYTGSDRASSCERSHQSSEATKPCPEPQLHERGFKVLCPDPALHARSWMPNVPAYNSATPSPIGAPFHKQQHAHHNAFGHPIQFHRATATGSPMPLLKVKSTPATSGDMRLDMGDSWFHTSANYTSRPRQYSREQFPQEYPNTASEHFQPGWYYAKENPAQMRPGPAMYSFSTAAAKVVGQDPAPDSRIRDSYRTDTLTPLARPPSRFRKNGLIALANARGVGKFYGGPSFLSKPPQRRAKPNRSHLPDDLRFRSSPPRPMAEVAQRPQPRKRSREIETPPKEVRADDSSQEGSVDPRFRLEEGEEVIEIDEETRAAVRMSLYGASVSDVAEHSTRTIRELSPNVMTLRKGSRRVGSRKKRRPSYWDGDLEEVVRSPAARRVVSSPIRKDDVASQQAEVEFEHDSIAEDVAVTDDELDGISRVVEGPTILEDDVKMED